MRDQTDDDTLADVAEAEIAINEMEDSASLDDRLEGFPVTTVSYLAILLVGAVLTVVGTIDYETWLKAIGIATPGTAAIGLTRVFDKYRRDGDASL